MEKIFNEQQQKYSINIAAEFRKAAEKWAQNIIDDLNNFNPLDNRRTQSSFDIDKE